MIYTKLKREEISLYHVSNWSRITQTEEYKKLRESIAKEGILDPVLVQNFPWGLRIEIGEQRLLIAKELNINELEAFVYGKPDVIHAKGEKMTSLEQIRSKFRNEEVPCYQVIKKYIENKVIEV